MKLVIAEYLRTLKERDELDRLLPDLLVEMGYVPVARPQTGNRQYGVDIAARGKNSDTGTDELLLLVVKQGDIGRTEWSSGNQAVRQSIDEIFDVYLKCHLEPQDQSRSIRIVVATSGELKQTVQANWSGFVTDNQAKAHIEFWGADAIATLIEKHLLDEHIFHDEDRRDLRRALALSGDSEYDRRDLHRLFMRTLDLNNEGQLINKPKTGKALLKALRIVNLSAQAFAHWTLRDDGDTRQGLFAVERAMLWTWHRIQLADEKTRKDAIAGPFNMIWWGYYRFAAQYFERVQSHCFVENSLTRYASNGVESSLIAFEQIGILASIALFLGFHPVATEDEKNYWSSNANVVADALEAWLQNNGVSSSPCLDRHSQDITLAMFALIGMGRVDAAKEWMRKLFRNVDYAYKAKKFVPVDTDSLDDLVEKGGWLGGQATDRMMEMSWMLATIAGWSVILGMDELYEVLAKNAKDDYPNVCIQLWHPEKDLYQHLYFQTAHFESGVAEAPIHLPPIAEYYRKQMDMIKESEFGKALLESPATKAGLIALDLIAHRHFSTPVSPVFWYPLMGNTSI
ncbi:MAG: hypothetical protein U1D70_01920 [Methylobacter sp.]|nr:hypothetical protein [Methylobacter sp.]MDP2428280.1 hypothetical protein [Methylobacter sp.]MDP3054994.1 hypothetical protein [Methylobacter sp.]MDP3362913.1 hypothetical protein [Methylobacter sp.]MDZ4217763.1 hypothetical protein [Methylobacter sp.]